MSNEGGPKGPRILVGDEIMLLTGAPYSRELATDDIDSPAYGTGSMPETTCDDSFDNDGDGYVDCEDADCDTVVGNTTLRIEECTQFEPKCAPAPVGDNCPTGLPMLECGKAGEDPVPRLQFSASYLERREKLLTKGLDKLTDGEVSQVVELLRAFFIQNRNEIELLDCEDPACPSDLESTDEDPDNN